MAFWTSAGSLPGEKGLMHHSRLPASTVQGHSCILYSLFWFLSCLLRTRHRLFLSLAEQLGTQKSTQGLVHFLGEVGAKIIGHPLTDSWSPWAYWKGGLAYWLAGLGELKLWEERAENGQESKSQSELDVVMGEEGPGCVCRGRRWRANSVLLSCVGSSSKALHALPSV